MEQGVGPYLMTKYLLKAHHAPKLSICHPHSQSPVLLDFLGTLLIGMLIKLLAISHSLCPKAGTDKGQNKGIQALTF